MGTAILERPVVESISAVVEAIEESNSEIMRRAGVLLSQGSCLSAEDFMRYCSLAGDIGYREMERTGREILSHGGTFPVMRILALTPQEEGYMLRVVEDKTNREFTFTCRNPLKQYDGNLIDLSDPNSLQAYRGKEVTIDVLRNGSGYEAVMIGLSKDVLGDAPQATRLDLLN